MITDPIKEQIKAAAAERFPREACGVVIQTADGQFFIECENTHPKPLQHFKISEVEWDLAEQRGAIICIWHTHPNARPEASWDDKATAEAWEIPALIYATPADSWDYYQPNGWEAPLLGRPFVFGVFDCWTLCVDHYRQKLGIKLPYFQTEYGWWHHQRDASGETILKAPEIAIGNIDAAGFHVVNELQVNDVVLMRPIHGAACHCGIWLGDGHLMHHFEGLKSEIIAYQPGVGFYGKATEYFCRHNSL
jgi:proteasome lid subunit RPN8/RPN11